MNRDINDGKDLPVDMLRVSPSLYLLIHTPPALCTECVLEYFEIVEKSKTVHWSVLLKTYVHVGWL